MLYICPIPKHCDGIFLITPFPLQHNSLPKSQPLILPFYKSIFITTRADLSKCVALNTSLPCQMYFRVRLPGVLQQVLPPTVPARLASLIPFSFSHRRSGGCSYLCQVSRHFVSPSPYMCHPLLVYLENGPLMGSSSGRDEHRISQVSCLNALSPSRVGMASQQEVLHLLHCADK